ncbi:PAP/fibrillin family protein [Synechococcus sp. CS-1328]|uniref:PAP/fibrillin family protein n=1 Tax=Synechococcus sp. CS-1328 TaxID=2847976 RepID=UPI00223BF23D|nr:PAP/fibrillin family protein [Synechococcus sp. CS-1328]MCT0224160.1 PAP/fibrillin family protein [Synechococcus sp. CS-1328]
MTTPPDTAEACRRALLEAQAHPPPQRRDLRPVVEQLERLQPADLDRDRALLRGVWELFWSSSSQPWLREVAWLENLQVLDPEAGRAMNLLRLRGPLGGLAAISVVAAIAVQGRQRVSVRFERGGWIGPSLGDWRPELLARVQQATPAWLDITVLDQELRLCRGNAGTLFALRRRPDLRPEDLLPAA